MKPGHVFTVEPALAEGKAESTKWPDGWTYTTIDGSWTAQFEHTPRPEVRGGEVLSLVTYKPLPRIFAKERHECVPSHGEVA